MPLIRNDSDYDGRTVRAIIRWAMREKEVTDYVRSVRVSHTGVNNPRRVFGGCWYPDTRHCVLKITRRYPAQGYCYKRRHVPAAPVFQTWQECLVWLAGHELEHARQQRARKPYKEAEAEWSAYRLHQSWLEKKGQPAA